MDAQTLSNDKADPKDGVAEAIVASLSFINAVLQAPIDRQPIIQIASRVLRSQRGGNPLATLQDMLRAAEREHHHRLHETASLRRERAMVVEFLRHEERKLDSEADRQDRVCAKVDVASAVSPRLRDKASILRTMAAYIERGDHAVRGS